jgi:LPXTG-site transpeptidase (sortase) family protein
MKASIKLPLLVIGVTAFLALLLFHFTGDTDKKPVSQSSMPESQEAGPVSSGAPVRLSIPAINVYANIQHVGVTPRGEMAVPSNNEDVGWFDFGPRPGEDGSAVMAGHYGTWKNGQDSVFDNLHALRAGDTLYIEDAQGAITSFVVRESRQYASEADAEDVFSSNDGKSHLNLITCNGVWDRAKKSYDKRLVVFTDIIQ